MTSEEPASIARPLLGGLCTLVIAMGIGRFAYTPILPGMQAALDLSHPDAGLLASLNFVGYLLGALAAGYLPSGPGRTWSFRAALVLSIATTGLMAATAWFAAFGLLRLLSGLVSGALFVWSADVVMRALARNDKASWAGVHFAGVGLGIALTGVLVPYWEGLGGWQGGWLGLAAVSVVFAVPAWLWIRDGRAGQPATEGSAPAATVPSFPLNVLALAYFLEGFGYIVSGTFLVSILQAEAEGSLIGPLAWTVVGLAAAPSCVICALMAERWGYVRVIALAHLLQAVGIVMPMVSNDLGPVVVAAMLFGGTFMGITTMVVAFARRRARGSGARAIGVLTASFGLGQILGPLVAGWLARGSGSFDAALTVAAGAVVLGAVLLGAGALATKPAARAA